MKTITMNKDFNHHRQTEDQTSNGANRYKTKVNWTKIKLSISTKMARQLHSKLVPKKLSQWARKDRPAAPYSDHHSNSHWVCTFSKYFIKIAVTLQKI